MSTATHICARTQLPYQLKRSMRRRTLALQIKQGHLYVLSPTAVPLQAIEQFIAQKSSWIERHLVLTQPPASPRYLTDQQVPLLDERLELITVLDQHSQVTREGQQLWVQLSRRVKPENRVSWQHQYIKDWYIQQAQLWFTARVEYWQTRMQVNARAVHIGQWQRRWGCCNHRAEVSFNWRLLLAPAWVADYVVVHELAHCRFMDHSREFWQLVAEFYPNYAEVKQWLKQHHHLLELLPDAQLQVSECAMSVRDKAG